MFSGVFGSERAATNHPYPWTGPMDQPMNSGPMDQPQDFSFRNYSRKLGSMHKPINLLQHPIFTQELFSGGTHSTASTIEWALAELLKNKQALFALREELVNKLGSTTCIKESQVSQLPYLHACVKETLRLHPPAPLLHPQAILESCEIMNYTVPKNSQLIINVWAMGRDPNLWADPLDFKPERFLESNVDFKGQHFKFLPFGVGRRMCPGYPYAIKQIHLMLASLVQNFDWSLPMEDLSKLDMSENFGIISQRKRPLMVIPKCIS